MANSVGVKISKNQFDRISGEIKSDLTAVFNVIEDEINELIKETEEEGWTPEEFISKVEKLIS